jgi:asparagine synthase (glutamine-hydrolysing)
MSEVLKHRGPDDEGVVEYPDAVFGHRRLSIIDPANGTQPMMDDTGEICISFNGEIYGHREIRQTLEAQGKHFRTKTDTEVVLKLYVEHGIKMLEWLPGAFAFAIWDNRRRLLFCARDRMGEKPFYFARTNEGGLVFSSELKGIMAAGIVTPEVDRSSLLHFLNRGYVQPNKCIFKNVSVLPPACQLTFDGHRLHVERYWSPPPRRVGYRFSDAVEQFSSVLETAIDRQLIADVDISFFLSGGLDSSAVLELASRKVENPKVYHFINSDEDSELPYANEIARHCGVDLQVLRSENVPFSQILFQLVRAYDEPFWDSSAPGVLAICNAASQHSKVIISGDGADELLGGYVWWYRAIAHVEELRSRGNLAFAAGLVRAVATRALGGLGVSGSTHTLRNYKDAWQKKSARELREVTKWGYSSASLRQLGFSDTEISVTLPTLGTLDGDLRETLNHELEDYLPGNMMVKVDRASMSFGLEVRCPFLDRDLVELVTSMPASFIVNSNADKILMREALATRLPKSVLHRKKQGFGTRVNSFEMDEEFKDSCHDLIHGTTSSLDGLIDLDGLHMFVENYPDSRMIFLTLAGWADLYLTAKGSK